jgi:hypothetical protein
MKKRKYQRELLPAFENRLRTAGATEAEIANLDLDGAGPGNAIERVFERRARFERNEMASKAQTGALVLLVASIIVSALVPKGAPHAVWSVLGIVVFGSFGVLYLAGLATRWF